MKTRNMTFNQVIATLRSGRAYKFGNPHLTGYFYQAPYPEDFDQTKLDGAISAITYWRDGVRASPTLMLYDFDDPSWWVETADSHPAAVR